MSVSGVPERLQIGEGALFQNLEDEVVLLNLSNQLYYGLDPVGARMWQLLMEHGNVSKVVELLHSQYDADTETLRKDLNKLIGDLLSAGLLRAV